MRERRGRRTFGSNYSSLGPHPPALNFFHKQVIRACEMLPQELGCGSGTTCWRRLRDWQEAGIWQLIDFVLDWLAGRERIDRLRAVVDGNSILAVFGRRTGPIDRTKLGSKRHLICDGRGIPLAIQLTGAKLNDSQHALALVDAVPPVQGVRGRPRHRPDCVFGDRGYDAKSIRQDLRDRGIMPLLAMRSAPSWLTHSAFFVQVGRIITD